MLSSISKLSQLRELHLSYNELTESLPSVIGELTRLEELYLPQCNIKDLPAR